MLEALMIGALGGFAAGAGVHLLLSWQIRLRVRECELAVQAFDELLVRRNKREAADASVKARKLNPVDEAILQQIIATQAQGSQPNRPWWAAIVKERKDGA